MISVAILGYSGMLGAMVFRYLSSLQHYRILLPSHRFHLDSSDNASLKLDLDQVDYIINCAGAIPQSLKTTYPQAYDVNYMLPDFLFSQGYKVIHPCTDCVFSGTPITNAPYGLSSPLDASDQYGISKSRVYNLTSFATNQSNIRVIRSSIIGPDSNSQSLLSWSLLQHRLNKKINGYTNHIWNGITTLSWAKHCHQTIQDFNSRPLFTVPTSLPLSKYDLIKCIFNSYGLDPSIVHPYQAENSKDKSLLPTPGIIPISIEQQLSELYRFTSP